MPYLIWADSELAGLALARRVDRTMSVAEFLVLPKFRRCGVGRRAAHQLFAEHPGRWHVGKIAGHDAASAFWRRVIPVPFDETVAADGSIFQEFTSEDAL